MERQIGFGCYIIHGGVKDTVADRKESEHAKKVKDPERAARKRKKLFGTADVGVPVDKPDPKHIIRKGKAIAGQHMEIPKSEFISACAKDDLLVSKAKDIVDKNKK